MVVLIHIQRDVRFHPNFVFTDHWSHPEDSSQTETIWLPLLFSPNSPEQEEERQMRVERKLTNSRITFHGNLSDSIFNINRHPPSPPQHQCSQYLTFSRFERPIFSDVRACQCHFSASPLFSRFQDLCVEIPSQLLQYQES